MIRLDILALLNFYDSMAEVRPDANAIKSVAGEELGLALLIHYLQEQGCQPTLLDQVCATKGNRLDGWIRVEKEARRLYQVEVKSWSMHGYGGRPLEVRRDTNMVEYRKRSWEFYWNAGRFKEKSLNKVLRRMDYCGADIEVAPLACLWSSLHPKGEEIPFFSIATAPPCDFEFVHIFSMSTYLREKVSAGIEMLDLELPITKRRMGWLATLFSPVSTQPRV